MVCDCYSHRALTRHVDRAVIVWRAKGIFGKQRTHLGAAAYVTMHTAKMIAAKWCLLDFGGKGEGGGGNEHIFGLGERPTPRGYMPGTDNQDSTHAVDAATYRVV